MVRPPFRPTRLEMPFSQIMRAPRPAPVKAIAQYERRLIPTTSTAATTVSMMNTAAVLPSSSDSRFKSMAIPHAR